VWNGNRWLHVVNTVTTGIVNQTETLTVTNGNVQGNRKSPNPISFTKDRWTFGNGFLINQAPMGYKTEMSGAVFGTSCLPAGPGPNFDTSFNWLYNETLSKLSRQSRGDLDMMVDLVEAGKTRGMVRDAYKLSKFVRRFSPKNWANNWLEYQYGWRPLVNSIYGAANQILAPGRPQWARYKARSAEVKQKIQTYKYGPGFTERWDSNISMRCEIAVLLKFSESTIEQMSNFTSMNPAGIIWELCPYSFVVDWVFNVGAYLRNMETACLMDLNFKSGYRTDTYRLIENATISGTSSDGPNSSSRSGNLVHTKVYKNRTVLGGYPTPLFPTFKADLGGNQLISAGALLFNHFNK
jgi:hypothetical protein